MYALDIPCRHQGMSNINQPTVGLFSPVGTGTRLGDWGVADTRDSSSTEAHARLRRQPRKEGRLLPAEGQFPRDDWPGQVEQASGRPAPNRPNGRAVVDAADTPDHDRIDTY